ncbi:hypothetical protein TNCV_3696761 [Trichonephila clavipes]|uniref:Uncharacterized protein n=1 Tax=Trichonephila clavipes TaxID=2585209 RepID=A0A8X6VJN2_TRICX|nr:hypothetical protein TNCV_3696761 [Trichonephila clavipes]
MDTMRLSMRLGNTVFKRDPQVLDINRRPWFTETCLSSVSLICSIRLRLGENAGYSVLFQPEESSPQEE